MSITQTRIHTPLAQDASPTSWAPEINDLQKYRDSLKVMAERVSQAEYMWAKSLEPQDLVPQQPSPARHVRKWSKTKRPTPLKRPVTPKRIRTDDGMYSPDPFQLLSPSAFSDDELSPIAFSASRSPLRRGRRFKRSADTSPVEKGQVAEGKAEELLQNAEDLLKDAVRLVKTTIGSTRDNEDPEKHVEVSVAAKVRRTVKQVRNAGVQVQGLLADARRYSKTVPADSKLFRNPLEVDDETDVSKDTKEHLTGLIGRLDFWTSEIAKARKDVIFEMQLSSSVTARSKPMSAT